MTKADQELFEKEYIIDQDDLLFRIYNSEKPNFETARLTKFLGVSSEDLRAKILSSTFSMFFKKQILPIENYQNYNLNFVGSIAEVFNAELKIEAAKYGCEIDKIMAKPIEGLIDYHLKN